MYRKAGKGWSKHIDFMLIDMISLELSFFLAFMLRHGWLANPLVRRSYFRMIFVLLMIDFVSLALMRSLSGVVRRGYFQELDATFRQAALVSVLSAFYLFSIQEGEDYSRITLVLTGVLYFSTSYITRCLFK